MHVTKVCLSSTGHSQTIPFSSSYFSHVRGPCLLVLPRITGSFRGFFVLFSSTTLETDRKYISTSWLRKVYPPIFKLTGRTPIDQSAGKVRENKSLATSLNTWQTKDYYFNGKSYLKTLVNPKKTWWRHLLYISNIFFLMMNLQLASLWAPY